MPEVQVASDNYKNALLQARTGNRVAIADKNARKAELIAMLHTLANYVMFVAKGDVAVMLSSGFELSRDMQPTPPLTKPEGLTVEAGDNPGELQVRINRMPTAKSYQFQYTPDPMLPNSNWQVQSETRSKTVIGGLSSGTRYWCRVGVVGVYGQLVYSDPMSHVTQ